MMDFEPKFFENHFDSNNRGKKVLEEHPSGVLGSCALGVLSGDACFVEICFSCLLRLSIELKHRDH